MGYESIKVDLNGLQLEWDNFGARIRYQDLPQSGGTIVGFPIVASGNFKLCGEALNMDDVYVIPPGGEADYFIEKDTPGLGFSVGWGFFAYAIGCDAHK